MKKITTLVIFILLLMVAPSIAQEKDKEAIRAYRDAEKAYKKKSLQSCLQFLSVAMSGTLKKKQQEEAEEILPLAYNEFFILNKEKATNLEKSSEQYNGILTVNAKKEIVTTYSLLHTIQTEIKKIPETTLAKCKILEQTKEDFHSKHTQAVEEYNKTVDTYAEEQYNYGLQALAKNTKPEAQIAHRFFNEVAKYKPSYKDLATKMEEAKQLGTYKVAIGSFENMTGVGSYDRLKGLIAYQLNNALKLNFKPEEELFFIEVIPIDATTTTTVQKLMLDEAKLQAFAKETKADLIIFGSIKNVQVTIGEVNTKSQERQRNVVVGQTTKIVDGKSKKVDVYDDVKATYFTYNQSKHSKINGNLYIYNAIAKQYSNREDGVDGNSFDEVMWYKYSGNIKALYSDEANKVKESTRQFKTDNEMIDEATISLVYSIKLKLATALKSINIVK